MKIKTALWPLQTAVYTCLTTNADLMSMINGVFDELPGGVKLPYVTIGDDTVNPMDTKTGVGEDITLTMHIWTMGPGKKENKQITDAVLQAITGGNLVFDPGFNLDGVKREFLNIIPDGPGYHGVCRFRFYITQN
jgi:hypothetical protein